MKLTKRYYEFIINFITNAKAWYICDNWFEENVCAKSVTKYVLENVWQQLWQPLQKPVTMSTKIMTTSMIKAEATTVTLSLTYMTRYVMFAAMYATSQVTTSLIISTSASSAPTVTLHLTTTMAVCIKREKMWYNIFACVCDDVTTSVTIHQVLSVTKIRFGFKRLLRILSLRRL